MRYDGRLRKSSFEQLIEAGIVVIKLKRWLSTESMSRGEIQDTKASIARFVLQVIVKVSNVFVYYSTWLVTGSYEDILWATRTHLHLTYRSIQSLQLKIL